MIPFLVLILLASYVSSTEFGFTIEVRPGKYECYFVPVTAEKHKTLEVDYQVVDGGNLDVSFMLILGADILAQDTQKTDGSHKIDIKALGDYQVCFDNTFSYQARKVVFFEVYLSDADGNIEDSDIGELAKNDSDFAKRVEEIGITLQDFKISTSKIKGFLNKIEFYQSTLRSYEHRDLAILNANFSRVSFWSMRLFLTIALIIGIQLANAQPPKAQPINTATQTAEEVVLQFVVEAGRIECLYQPITDSKHVAMEIDYQVTEGGETDINFFVKNPRNVQIIHDNRKRENSHKIQVDDPANGFGDYVFCFDNSFSTHTKKNVFFEIFLLDKDGNFLNNYEQINNRDLLTSVNDFERITTKVKNNLNQIEKLQVALRAVESRDRSIMEENFERVNFWSTLHLLAILVIIGLQLFMIRSLFEEKSKVGRILRKGRLND
ncbi:hypothetical protein M3Y97_00779200 [Aphelenchoides bicaudatus]|nr:hypothetical protein M3Y97_00779200 [Aphelenchoides bicaudatus]